MCDLNPKSHNHFPISAWLKLPNLWILKPPAAIVEHTVSLATKENFILHIQSAPQKILL